MNAFNKEQTTIIKSMMWYSATIPEIWDDTRNWRVFRNNRKEGIRQSKWYRKTKNEYTILLSKYYNYIFVKLNV